MITSKEKLELGRAEAVQRFHTLARQIEEGKVMLGGQPVKIPDNIRLEIKSDNEEIEIGMKWKAPDK